MELEEDVYVVTVCEYSQCSRAHMRMNIQSLHTFGFVLTFALFSGLLVAFAVVGAAFGPTVLVDNVARDIDLSKVEENAVEMTSPAHVDRNGFQLN
jgi:hypothetical protein